MVLVLVKTGGRRRKSYSSDLWREDRETSPTSTHHTQVRMKKKKLKGIVVIDFMKARR